MKISHLIQDTKNNKINKDFVKEVEKTYSCKLTDPVKHILSITEIPEDYKEESRTIRKLQNNMILEADKEMQSDFINRKLLPIFDMFDNDYLCYDYKNNIWCMFNTTNGLVFNKQENFADLF